MNLADMLAYADIHELSRIAKHYRCECSTHSKNELIQSILSAINRKEVFESTVHSMSIEDIRFVNTFLFDQRDAFSLEELLAWARQTQYEDRTDHKQDEKEHMNPRETISKFKQYGWLFNGYSHQTKYLFTIPRDLRRRIGDSIGKHLMTRIEATGEPSVYREEHDLFLTDIRQFLEYVRNHEVLLTADGFIYKRQLQQILQFLQVTEQPVSRGGWRFGYGRKFKEYPSRFSLLYDYCYYNQYIVEEKEQLLLTDHGLKSLLSSRQESPMDVYRFWLRLYKGAVGNIQAIVQWISRLTQQWASVESLKSTLCPFIKPYYYDTPPSILEQRLLQMMMHLGLLRTGSHPSFGDVVQMTDLGKSVVHGTYVDERDFIQLPDEKHRDHRSGK